MNQYICSLKCLIARSILVVSLALLAPIAHADELKDISQMADQGQVAAAIDRLNTYLTANPKNAQALFMKGVLLADQGRRDEALRIFTDLTEKFPNLPEPYNNQAVIYADQGHLDKAKEALEAAIKTNSSYGTAHENLGDIYARMASEAYDKALELDTDNKRAQGKLLLIKHLFGNANKTTIVVKNPAKTTAKSVSPLDTEVLVTKKATLPPIPTIELAKNTNEDITNALKNWVQAWSSKNLKKYFASYSASFKPAKGESRKVWEQQRRERLTKPATINVQFSNIKITSIDDNTVKVQFKQFYGTDSKSKPLLTNKTLIMKKEDSAWLIEQELPDN